MLEFVSTIYALKTIATKTVISKHRKALRSLLTKRMLKHKDYFSGNDLIISSYDFAYKVFSVL